ncbi:MAG TPA: hypothetical protein VMT34_13145, partial [Aggregatilineales bacterium]|nr:hypothetical protein [Aggregatilineales bacterium]
MTHHKRCRLTNRRAGPIHDTISAATEAIEMNGQNLNPAKSRFFPFGILMLITFVAAGVYLTAGRQASGKPTPVLPLDDAYIHFQYARAMAEGHPLHYNPDQPATSGGTSLLYPAFLAVGYAVGFRGESLGWWALAIGVLAWLGAVWLFYRVAIWRTVGGRWIAVGVATAFTITGCIAWANLSGMETPLMILFTLLTLDRVIRDDLRGTLIAGVLVTLTRPEGLVIGLLAVLYGVRRRRNPCTLLAALPVIIAAGVQPTINLLATGSATASGLQAKSYLYLVPPDTGKIIILIGNNFLRLWGELISGYSPDDGAYISPYLFLMALLLVGIGVYRVWRPARSPDSSVPGPLAPVLLVAGWLVGLSAVVATLETAFWQFKRYQQPLIVLLFVLGAWTLIELWGDRQWNWRTLFRSNPLQPATAIPIAFAAIVAALIAFS